MPAAEATLCLRYHQPELLQTTTTASHLTQLPCRDNFLGEAQPERTYASRRRQLQLDQLKHQSLRKSKSKRR
jgi:hypothetical protein